MNLNHLAVFRAVAERQSFSGAATALGADKAHVSRVVSALEQALGVVLLARSTRKVTLTPAGEGLFALVRGPLDALERAGPSIAERVKAPSGVVVLATTKDLAQVIVAPLLPAFRARFPEVSVQLRVGQELESFDDPSLDLAMRVGRQSSNDVRVRKLGDLELGFFASPRYLAARTAPRALADLAQHETAWPYDPKSKRSSFGPTRTPAPSIACDDFTVILEFACAAGGIAVLPTHIAMRAARDGELSRVLPDIALGAAPLYLVTRRQRPLPARVQALSAFLAEHAPLRLR
ncbi:MAG: LysR family transcriptional regulator [Myxococcales bacterium]|nr:LysR family transcriptional regulator [Myxococcales bacterium]